MKPVRSVTAVRVLVPKLADISREQLQSGQLDRSLAGTELLIELPVIVVVRRAIVEIIVFIARIVRIPKVRGLEAVPKGFEATI